MLYAPVLQLSAFGQTTVKQGNPVPASFCINDSVMTLYGMINKYRVSHNLPPIPLSKSLCYVASLHARDLLLHHPDKGGCNSYSWSDKSTLWKPFCYPRDENKKNSVWDKPRELTKYPAKAYEIVYWENTPLINDTIMMVWKTEDFFNSFLLNTGKWQGKTWNAIGISVYENYACAWFGEASDPEGTAFICGAKPDKRATDTIKTAPKKVVPAPAPVKQKKTRSGKTVVSKTDSVTLHKTDTVKLNAAIPPPVTQPVAVKPADSIPGTYYVIVKTNLPGAAARDLVNTLKSGEYPGARVLDFDGKIRVSVFESADKTLVQARLKEVKKTYKDAWLLKR